MSTKQRQEIETKYLWDIEAMYPDIEACRADMDAALDMAAAFAEHKGKLAESGTALASALSDRDALWQVAERAYVYARMKRDEDNRVSKYQELCDQTRAMVARISEATSFFHPEFAEIPERKVRAFLKQEPALKMYEHAIDGMLRARKHVLSHKEETLLAQMSELSSATNDAFIAIPCLDYIFQSMSEVLREGRA